ncbi:MAG: hypothetical protein ABSB32_00910 [Thermodesulfobacteriota bacterium]|jgi:hypothetical protein
MAEIGKRLSISKEICGYGLALKQYTHVNLLGGIVPQGNVEVITMKNPSELGSRIESLREKVRRNWVRLAVENEIKNGFLDLIQGQGSRICRREDETDSSIDSPRSIACEKSLRAGS